MKNKNTGGTGSDPVRETAEELRNLVRDAEGVLASGSEVTDSKIEELRERLRLAMDEARARLDELRVAARDQVDRADEYVHEHPYHAVGVAALVGALAGILLSRRIR